MAKYLTLTFLTFFLAVATLQAQVLPERPNPPRLVNDLANILSSGEEDLLEEKLVDYDEHTTTQIAVVTVLTTDGMDIREYTTRLANSWGVGSADKDNGIVFLAAIRDRKVFIATGDGMQEVMPDETVQLIINQLVVPNFKKQFYYKGIDEATDEIIRLLGNHFRNSGEETSSTIDKGYDPDATKNTILGFVIFAVMLLVGGGGIAGIVFLCKHMMKTSSTAYSSRGYENSSGWGGSQSNGGVTNVIYNRSSSESNNWNNNSNDNSRWRDSSNEPGSSSSGSSSSGGSHSSSGSSYSGGGSGGSYSGGSSSSRPSGSSSGSSKRSGSSFSGGGAAGSW